MRRLLLTIIIILSCGMCLTASAQSKDYQLTINVTAETGESLEGLEFLLEIPDWGIAYASSETKITSGRCVISVYGATHHIVIAYPGLNTYENTFDVTGDMTLNVNLTEKVVQPFSLKTRLIHDALTGQNDVSLTWNREEPAFFDDFESYDDWAVSFGEWTGIDNDQQSAAALSGSYPNRGSLQYATVVNPLTVVPTWWYDYPVLRPYSGNQYIGFVRTASGNANDDWLISPMITVKNDNILRFMAKAADVYPERFQVAITTAENPDVSDFTLISEGNYETVEYTEWRSMEYDLSEYAGQTVRIAIHYVSNANMYGAFMLMVDDFYVGQPDSYGGMDNMYKACRVEKSPANPYEKFEMYMDGNYVGETEDYSYVFSNVAEGEHQFGVKAVYRQSETEMSTVNMTVSNADCHRVALNVTTNNGESADGSDLELLDNGNGESIRAKVADDKVVFESLPAGKYTLTVQNQAYDVYREDIDVSADIEKDIQLKEHLFEPYNITVDLTSTGDAYNATVKWNQDLGFSDSFESYDDFATGSFGGWLTIDNDKLPVYPIALGSVDNIVTFPGSGDAYNPVPIAPMVFNPFKTVPAMAPTDPAIMAPTGEKSVIFFSPQMATADKWLISPPQAIRDNYIWQLTAKAYTQYPEIIRFCISTSQDISSFTVLDEVSLPYDEWTVYTIDLSAYAGQTVYLAVNYVSTDAFIAQVDDFYVGPEDDDGSQMYVGNVLNYEVYLDGVLKGSTEATEYKITGIEAGTHVVGIKAVYKSGTSGMSEYEFMTTSGVSAITDNPVTAVGRDGEIVVSCGSDAKVSVTDLSGRTVRSAALKAGTSHIDVPAGVYIVNVGSDVFKIIVR